MHDPSEVPPVLFPYLSVWWEEQVIDLEDDGKIPPVWGLDHDVKIAPLCVAKGIESVMVNHDICHQ